MSSQDNSNDKKTYDFGGIEVFKLEELEEMVLKETVYLDIFAGSDVAFKDNISEISPLNAQQVLTLGTYSYNYKTDEFPQENFPQGQQFGLMANEVAQVFPECVKKNENGHLFLNYQMLVPLMLETIKSMNARLASLEDKLNKKN